MAHQRTSSGGEGIRPISAKRSLSRIRVSEPNGRLRNNLIRVSNALNASRNAKLFSTSVPSAAAGSGIPQ